MAFRDRPERKTVTMNVTPLIDVLFLLIIFFTLTSTFKRVGELELQLPESSTSEAPSGETTHTVEVVVKEDGQILLDGEIVPARELRSILIEIARDEPEGRVMIKAEAGVQHGEVVSLLDLVRDAGFVGAGIGTHMAGSALATPE